MTQEEFLKGIFILENSFNSFQISDKEETLMIWYEMLNDQSPQVYMNGIRRHLAMSKFPPTIADLRERMQETTNPTSAFTADIAWSELTSAIRKFGSYREKEALESMSLITRSIVSALSYRQLCLSETLMADRAHFMKMFEQYKVRERQGYLLPEAVKAESRLIQGHVAMLADCLSMEQKPGLRSLGEAM